MRELTGRSKTVTRREVIPRLMVTVLMVNGRKAQHTYDIPLDRKKSVEFINNMSEMVATVMKQRKETCLQLSNPDITYNPDHVLGVRFDTIESKRMEEVIEKAQRKMGLSRD